MDTNNQNGWRSGWEHRRIVVVGAAVLLAGGAVKILRGDEATMGGQQAPEMAGIAKWINGDAIKIAEQRGKVVVLHFWTFGCINCQHNLPFYNRWFADFAKDDVRIIGVHTPETTGEGDLEAVVTNVQRLGIKYPVAVDNERATWGAYGNRYWPSIYLIDKKGQIRYRWEGELEYGGKHGDAEMRTKIRELSAEGA